MEAWAGQVWAGISSATVVIVVIGTLAQAFLKRILDGSVKELEARLRVAGDTEIERLRNELSRDGESHKMRLKKSEFLFGKEFEAATAFVTLHRGFGPRFSRPNMEWDDACNQIADRFEEIENRLETFLTVHGAILLSVDRDAVHAAIAIAGQGKFDVIQNSDPMNSDHGPQIREEAGKLWNALRDVEARLLEQVRGQSST